MPPSNTHRQTTLPDPSAADLARAAAGDEQAFRDLVERYQGMVYTVAHNILGNHAGRRRRGPGSVPAPVSQAAPVPRRVLVRHLAVPAGRHRGRWTIAAASGGTPPQVNVREQLGRPRTRGAGARRLWQSWCAAWTPCRPIIVCRWCCCDVHGPRVSRGLAELLGRPLGNGEGDGAPRPQRRASSPAGKRLSGRRTLMTAAASVSTSSASWTVSYTDRLVAEFQAHLSFCGECAARAARESAPCAAR